MIPLKNVLLINSVSSGATGLGLVVFSKLLSSLFQINQSSIFIGTGIFLIGFAVLVLSAAMQTTITTKSVQLIITLDITWTVVSAILVLFYSEEISAIGNFLIVAVALWVAAMAYLQTKGLKQITI